MKFVFGILVFIVTTIILIILVVSLFRSLKTTSSTPATSISSSYNLSEAGASETSAKFTVSGPIVADEKYQSVRITIDKSSRKVEILKGYNGVVDKVQTLPNNKAAYEAFLQALSAAKYTNYRENKADIRSTCVTGSRYVFELSAVSTKKVDAWTTSCAGKSGTFAGDAGSSASLYRAQIPNYSEFTSGVSVY